MDMQYKKSEVSKLDPSSYVTTLDKEKSLKTERMKEQIHGYEDQVS